MTYLPYILIAFLLLGYPLVLVSCACAVRYVVRKSRKIGELLYLTQKAMADKTRECNDQKEKIDELESCVAALRIQLGLETCEAEEIWADIIE